MSIPALIGFVAEASAVGFDTKKAFVANGYEEMARATGAKAILELGAATGYSAASATGGSRR